MADVPAERVVPDEADARAAPLEPALDCPVADPSDDSGAGAAVTGVSTAGGLIAVVGNQMIMVGDIGTDLCLAFRRGDHDLGQVDVVDARKVTFLGSPGLSLLAEVARVRGAGVPLWAGRATTRPLRLTGLDRLFDVHPTP